MEAATKMFWKKRYSYKQLFWKLPGEIFHQNSWKISLKKFLFSKVAQSRSRKLLPNKETDKKHNFHKFLYWVKTSGNVTESCRQSACNFTKNELLHSYFSGILTANFRTSLFQNASQVAASAEAYSGPCQTSKMKHFCEYN